MGICEEPITIGAEDLLKVDNLAHCGDIYVLCKRRIGKKWKQRYVIISKGCFYVYLSRKATKQDQSYSLKQFESATECVLENGEKGCFRLNYTTLQNPISFLCDTPEHMTKWIQRFQEEISEVKRWHSCSADSGFGSAEATVIRSGQKTPDYAYAKYDEVNESFLTMATCVPVQPSEDDDGYENSIGVLVSDDPLRVNKSPDGDRSTGPAGTSEKDTHSPPSDNLINELKNHVEGGQIKQRLKPKALVKPTVNRSPATSHASMSPFNQQGTNAFELSINHMSSADQSFVSVRSGANDSVPSCDFEEHLDENNHSGNTSPKVRYENPETLQSMPTKTFTREDYFCADIVRGKGLLKEQEVGHFGENSNGVLVSDDPLRVNKSPDGDNYKRNDHRSTGPTGTSEKDTHAPPSDNFINELKNRLEGGQIKQRLKPKTLVKPTVNRSPATSHASMSPFNRQGTNAFELSINHMPSVDQSFVSVRSGANDSVPSCDFEKHLYENDNSGNTSPKVRYENPETLQNMQTKIFARDDYFCADIVRGKWLLKEQEVGHFGVFPVGDNPHEYELYIQTHKGLKCFRIYSQNSHVSLYKLHEADTFSSLDKLLSFYSMHDLPSREYQVKLQYGCYSRRP